MNKTNNNFVEPTTASLLEELLRRLMADRDSIEEKIQAVKHSLSLQKDSPIASQAQTKRVYRPKGTNRKAIIELFEANNGLALGIAQIAERAGLPPSSTSVTLKKLKKDGLFEQTEMGLWRKKSN